MKHAFALTTVIGVWLGLMSGAMAQEKAVEADLLPEDKLESTRTDEVSKDGWYFTILPSSTFSFNDNRKVAGQVDGYTLNFGLNFELKIDLYKGKHEWRNLVLLNESISRTPLIDEFFLSADRFFIESMYLYYLLDWFGFYGRALMDTAIFPNYDIQPEKVTYAITWLDGTPTNHLDDKVRLTDFFSPLQLRQGLGPFFRPLKSEKVNLEFLLGLAFREGFMKGDLAVADDDATPERDLTELDDFVQIGGESINRIWGELWDKKINYAAGVQLMMPFYNDPDPAGLSGADLLVLELGTRWSFRFFEWLSLDYEFKAIKDSQIVDEWQIQNNILLNLNYAYRKFVAWGGDSQTTEPPVEEPPASDG